MNTPARLEAALARLEARRVHLERQIIAEIEAKYFSDPQPEIIAMTSSHDRGIATGATIGAETDTSNGSHITTTWVAAE